MNLKESKPKSVQKLGEKAENYVEAHATEIVFGIDPKPSNIRSLRTGMRHCHICRAIGHLQHQCPNSLSFRGIRRNANTAALRSSLPRQYGQPPQQSRPARQTQQPGSGVRCYTCGKPEHFARNCFEKPKPAAAMIREAEEQFRETRDKLKECYVQYDEPEYKADELLDMEETEIKTAACQPLAKKPTDKPRMSPCRQHNKVLCPQCWNMPAHRCQAMIVVCQDCGQHHPVVADACLLQDKTYPMPVTDGTVEGKPAKV